MHRAIWERWNDAIVEGMTIDHVSHGDFGGLDNRIENLRLATRREQQGNRRKSVSTGSKFKGVYWHSRAGKWAAQIHVNDHPEYLGVFSTEEAAACAYDVAAISRFGEFAKLNFPAEAA